MFRNNQTCVHLSRHPSSVLRGVRAHSSSFQLQRHPSRVLSSFAPIRVAFIFRTHPSRILCADPSHFHLSRPSESLSSLPYLSRVIRANPSRFHISRPSNLLYLSRPSESRPSPIRVAFIFRVHPSRFLRAHLSLVIRLHPSRPSESLSLAASDSNDPSRFHLSLHPSRVLSFAPIRVAFIFRAHPRPSESLSSFAPFESRPSRPSGSLSNGSGKTKDSLIRPLFEGPSGLSIETMSARSRVQPRHVPPMAR